MDMDGIGGRSVDDASGILTIDLGALCDNYRLLSRQASPASTAAVVKADAYGLGADRVAPVLYREGCRTFFVAHFIEAVRLRPLLPADASIYVLNGLQPGTERRAADIGITPVLNSLQQVRNWAGITRGRLQPLAAALQVDTGMSRLGLSADELEAVLSDKSLLAGCRITYVMSHLASADDPGESSNQQQLAVMRAAAARFPEASVSFANSGGIFLGADFHGGLTRPGIALYGGTPSPAASGLLKPVVRLSAQVIQTRTVPAGTRVGYGGAQVTTGETRLATISVGYADGIPRHLSGSGAAYFGDTRLPFFGRVSMDSLTVDISAVPADALGLGSFVELIGEHQTLEDIADAAGTISYEILTRLGQRYRRRYIHSGTSPSFRS